MATGLTNRLLGYPADARCLILNADDLGMCNPVNEAIFRALKEGVVTSTSLMVPCPGASRAMSMLQENPEIPFGIHLTVIRDHVQHGWRPLTPNEKVPTLANGSGCFYDYARIPEFLIRADVGELETEFRAQIEAALAAQLKPTHLDWHCLQDGGRDDIFDLTLALAREYGLAMRVHTQAKIDRLQLQGLPTSDHEMLDSYHVDAVDKSAHFARLLRELPAGLSEWAVHPGIGNAELQAIDPGWKIRQADLDFLISPEAQAVLKEEGINFVDYRALQAAWDMA